MDRLGKLFEGPIDKEMLEGCADKFAEAVKEKTDDMENPIAFIDGTVLGVSRQKGNVHQLLLYKGNKRKYAIKFQSVVTPDGMCIDLSGPFFWVSA